MEAVIYETAKRWHKLPYEIKLMPAAEFYKMLEIESIESEFGR